MRILFFLLFFLMGTVSILFGVLAYVRQDQFHKQQAVLSALHSENQKTKSELQRARNISVSSNTSAAKANEVGEIIDTYTKSLDGDISVYYKNLSTGDSVVVDSEREYYMASLYKVIVTLYVLEAEKAGKVTLKTPIGSPPISMREALEKIITESNNEYAEAIAAKYTWKTIEEFIKARFAIDFTFTKRLQSDVVNMGILFESIAKSEHITDDQSNYLLQLLNDQQRTSKLPKYLPKNIYSHNKTGELDQYSHDAGIFYTPKANYVLIFMSKTPNPGVTNEQIALMSKAVYTALNE